jgi:Flp pilus assembly pilin Flp
VLSLFRRFVAEDGGQALMEYALVAVAIAFASAAAFQSLESTLASAYVSRGSAIEDLAEMPAPSGG